uniref:Coiled-coil domain-containing protein n=1 Tax=Mola mola TaxID=94237 RepID=A0A3Q4BVB9_MOLML
CRDFAVLEDRCLAYNLQEQEESHLAHNVNKSKLVQKDLQVAKKLQEEEDQWAKVQSQKQHSEALQDNEIAQGIQEELIRQAEQQRQQEEKDAAIARKLQEKEMKEERRRQKQLEATFEEDYFEDHGYGVSEATKGMTKLELREQELKDMEVARRMQEEEMKEIARLMMEQEKREYKKIREREHEREREKERE